MTKKENWVGAFLGLGIGIFLVSIFLLMYNFLSVPYANTSGIFKIWFLLILVSCTVIICGVIPGYNQQMIIFSKRIPIIVFCITDLLLFVLLLLFLYYLLFANLCIYDISAFASIMTLISGSIFIPAIKYIINIPTIKVEVLDDRLSYNRNSILEFDADEFINVRAINNNNDPQVIKFLGFYAEEDITSILVANDMADNDTFFLPDNMISMIETVSPHSVSKTYSNIAISKIIIPKEENQDEMSMFAVYKNEDGNLFSKAFVVKNVKQVHS